MEIPKSGIRGFFEILMPGVFLLLNLLGTLGLLMAVFASKEQQAAAIQVLGNQTVVLSFILSAGYLIGVILRLFRTQAADDWSGKLLRLVKRKWRKEAFLRKPFFYGEWLEKKCRERLPPPALDFYQHHWAPRDTDDGAKNTTFYNLCKAFINQCDEKSASEVFALEAMCRFIAGCFYALIAALALLAVDALVIWFWAVPHLAWVPPVLASVYVVLAMGILFEFRTLRLKEVDVVFVACLLNREKFETHFRPSEPEPPFAARQRLLEDVWRESSPPSAARNSISLERLVSCMKKASAAQPFLSSLYFAGADVDHPYFLKNEAVAMGLAVLPEDAVKAGRRKRHPHQTEVLFVLRGQLHLFWEKGRTKHTQLLREGDCHVIPKNTYHWIKPDHDGEAVFLFVKTDPAKEPRSED